MEQLGLVILKDENGSMWQEETANIKINGENFKPLLTDAVSKLNDVTVINQLNITDYLVNNNKIEGRRFFHCRRQYGLRDPRKGADCNRRSRRTYRRTIRVFRHKMWYPPFNTRPGYAIGMEAGAEMTPHLRCALSPCAVKIRSLRPERLHRGSGQKQIKRTEKCMRQIQSDASQRVCTELLKKTYRDMRYVIFAPKASPARAG